MYSVYRIHHEIKHSDKGLPFVRALVLTVVHRDLNRQLRDNILKPVGLT